MFTRINKLENKELVVLFQGDSWMDQITFPADKNFISVKLVQNFKSKKKIEFVNGGTGSYSPSLMNLQLDVLEKDFKIIPNIVIAYIDQTDIGDENCRYKNNKVYVNGILKSVQPESHLMYRDLFNYSQIYGLSKIYLNNNSKIFKTFYLINFNFKYNLKKSIIRFYRKNISRKKKDKERIKKCYANEIERYLINPNHSEIKYFADIVREYIKKIEQKKHIQKLFLVTAPHKKHFYKNYYNLNVSNIIDNIVKDKKDITHINFSKILLNDKNFNFEEDIWTSDEAHFNSSWHGNLFIRKILNELSAYLIAL